MKKIYTAQNSIEAHFISGRLHADGIPNYVQGDHLQSIAGAIPVGVDTACTVWIENDEDEEKAISLIKHAKDS